MEWDTSEVLNAFKKAVEFESSGKVHRRPGQKRRGIFETDIDCKR
jgi:hypothetical protein